MRPALSLQSHPDRQRPRGGDSGALRFMRRMRQSLPRGSQENPFGSLPCAIPSPFRRKGLRVHRAKLRRLFQRYSHRQARGGAETSRLCRSKRNGNRRAVRQRSDRRAAQAGRTGRLPFHGVSGIRRFYPQILSGVDRQLSPGRFACHGALQISETDLRRRHQDHFRRSMRRKKERGGPQPG